MGTRRDPHPFTDPRGVVASGFLLMVAVIAGSATLLVQSVGQAHRTVGRIQNAIEVPLGHLGDALEADTAGESLLQRAVVATGEARNELLARSIAAGEAATKAWTSYRASAIHLPGEAELAATYERDYAAGQAVTGRVLVPLVRSTTPGSLPDEQIVAAELDRQDLIALQRLYEAADRAALRSLDRQHAKLRDAVLIGAVALGLTVLGGFGVALRAARRAVAERRQQAAVAEIADLEARLIRALEFTDSEEDAFRITARALSEARPEADVAIVVADASQATFTPIVATTACGVETVEQCRASRASSPLQFGDSGALDACPVLAAGATTPCAVTCVPVMVAGIHAAVVQLTGPVGAVPEIGDAVPLVVRRLGDRLTTTRAFARFQLQASHDPLTGLLNRRSLEDAIGRLTGEDTPFAVAFADLDQFKVLNDVHGHDVGDRALRAFAATLRTGLRPGDLVGRWGGEEFVAVLPNCDQEQAIEAMERVRGQLATEALDGTKVVVTVSAGVAVRALGESFAQVLARADHALRVAKAAGRDRVEAWRAQRIPPVDPAAEDAGREVLGTSAPKS